MEALALVLFAIYFAIAFVYRTWIQIKRTGDSGFRGLSGRIGSVEWTAGILFALALIVGVAAPIVGLMGLPILPFLDHRSIPIMGIVLAASGIVGTLASQLSMGASWRVGVDAAERTALVTDGAFGLVRNPIFTAMMLTGSGLVLIVPNVVGVAGLLMLWVAIELQVRHVEEPYLAQVHTAEWATYTAGVGRFLPGLGLAPHQEQTSRT